MNHFIYTSRHFTPHGKTWTQLIDLAPNVWLHSSVGRASHRYRGGHGFESRWSPDFFQASVSNCLSWKIYCDDHSLLSLIYQLNKMVKLNLVPRVLSYSAPVARERPWSGLVTCLLNLRRWQANNWREGRNGKLFVSTVPGWESKSVAIQGKEGKRSQKYCDDLRWNVKCKTPTNARKRFMNRRVQVVAVCVNWLETLHLRRICLEKEIVLCSQRRR